MLKNLEAPASTPVTTARRKGVHPLTKTELQAIVDRHNGELTDAFHHDVLLTQGFPGNQPWANESFPDPVVNAYLMERYATSMVN